MKRYTALSMAGFMTLSTFGFTTNVIANEVETTEVDSVEATSNQVEKMSTEVPTEMFLVQDYVYLKWNIEGNEMAETGATTRQYVPYKVHAGDTVYFRSTMPFEVEVRYDYGPFGFLFDVPKEGGNYGGKITVKEDCYISLLVNVRRHPSEPILGYADVEVLYLLNGTTYEEVDLTGVEPEPFYGTSASSSAPTEFCPTSSYQTDFNGSTESILYSDYVFPASQTQMPVVKVSSENDFVVTMYDVDNQTSNDLQSTYNNNTKLYELSYVPDYNFYFSIENLGLPNVAQNTSVTVTY